MDGLRGLIPDWGNLSLDEIAKQLAELPKEVRDEIVDTAVNLTAGMKWIPQQGAQEQAFFCKADILFFGGQAHGGKSDLGLGLAFTSHKRSLLLREQYVELSYLTDRAIAINGTKIGYNGSSPPSLRTTDSRFLQFSGGDPDKVTDWMGIPFDFKFFDEAVNFAESVIRFHIAWLRSTEPGQRTRIVLGSNPPVTSQGDWIIPMFAPWLDITYPNPAKAGELRWCVTDPDGRDFWVDGPEPHQFSDGKNPVIPMSRTFIPSHRRDNKYSGAEYESRLDAMPEPYRSALRDGNFMASRADQENQVFPTEWLRAAQRRWTPDGGRELQMSAMALDPGGGGGDKVTIARRHAEWYAPMIAVPGKDAPDGSTQAALVVKNRRDMCGIVVDVGGGYGGDVCNRLKDNQIIAKKFNGSGASAGRAKDGSGRIFVNMRAQASWRFREALNPDQPGGSLVELPDDPEMIADLAALRFVPDILKIQIEDKKEVRKRLGRSPDKGDAVIMAWEPGDVAVKRIRGIGGQGTDMPERQTRANIGYADMKKAARS